jgi:hypothetical protein
MFRIWLAYIFGTKPLLNRRDFPRSLHEFDEVA